MVASTALANHPPFAIWAWPKTIRGELPVNRLVANPPAERSWAGFLFRFFLPFFFGFFATGQAGVAADRGPNCATEPEEVWARINGAAILAKQ